MLVAKAARQPEIECQIDNKAGRKGALKEGESAGFSERAKAARTPSLESKRVESSQLEQAKSLEREREACVFSKRAADKRVNERANERTKERDLAG